MGIDPFPTSPHLQHYIRNREMVVRRREWTPEEVEKIFAYGAIVGSAISSYESLGRGMDRARQEIAACEQENRSFASGSVILARQLVNGKGRFKRFWHAPEGGLWMTLVLVNTLLPETSRLLPLAAGVACCETVNGFGIPGRIKWVNDVLATGRKLAGILVETLVGRQSGEEYILIGVGLNVNNDSFPDELRPLAVSMTGLAGRRFDLREVATDLLAKFAWNIGLLYYEEERFLAGFEPDRHGPAPRLLDRWRELSDSTGRRVLFGYDVQERPQYEAEVLGLDDDGGLRLLHLADRVVVTEYGGEITYLA